MESELHPALWRASELSRGTARTLATGYGPLSAALPGGGWPLGCLVELLLQQPGVGEMRLLYPALQALDAPVVLLQPPHMPNAMALQDMGMPLSRLWWVRTRKGADTLWTAEQVLRSGSCAALLCWHEHLAMAALRRLQLAAQQGDTLFILLRSMQQAPNPSPAVLRLSLSAAPGGVQIGFLKRRGPQRQTGLFLPLQPSPVSVYRHAPLDSHQPAVPATRSIRPALVS